MSQELTYYQLGGLGSALCQLIKLQGPENIFGLSQHYVEQYHFTPVVGDEANLRPSIARQLVQLVHEGVAEGAQVARLQGCPRHIQQEQVDSRLGRSQHVLLWRNELDC